MTRRFSPELCLKISAAIKIHATRQDFELENLFCLLRLSSSAMITTLLNDLDSALYLCIGFERFYFFQPPVQ